MPEPLILAVCTGNICRSPFVERMLAARSPEPWRFASAGVRAVRGAPISPPMAERITRLGGQAGAFAAQQLTAEMADRAALIVALERAHRSAIVKLAPSSLRRVFTLREIGRIAPLIPPTGPIAPAFLAPLLEDYRSRALTPEKSDDDVPDPFGGSRRAYDRAVAVMDGPVTALARLLGR